MPKISHPKCPFFRRQTADSIVCEGMVGQHAEQLFDKKEAKDCWRRKYCGSFGYKRCPYYRGVLREVYDEDNG